MQEEVQSERHGTSQCTDMTYSEGDENVKLQCSKSHTQVSWREVAYIRDLDTAQSRIC